MLIEQLDREATNLECYRAAGLMIKTACFCTELNRLSSHVPVSRNDFNLVDQRKYRTFAAVSGIEGRILQPEEAGLDPVQISGA